MSDNLIHDEVKSLFEFTENSIQNDVSNFNQLLDTISSTEDRKKELWKKIYYNALIDRRNSFMMYADLVSIVEKDKTQHAVLGTHIAKYLERMSKANDQLIKLAEIVESKVQAITADQTSNENLYDLIEQERKGKKK